VYSNLVAVPRDGESEPLAQIYSFQATPSPQFLHRGNWELIFQRGSPTSYSAPAVNVRDCLGLRRVIRAMIQLIDSFHLTFYAQRPSHPHIPKTLCRMM